MQGPCQTEKYIKNNALRHIIKADELGNRGRGQGLPGRFFPICFVWPCLGLKNNRPEGMLSQANRL